MNGRTAQLASALDALLWVGSRRSTFTARELAEALGLHRRSGYRLAQSLEAVGATEIVKDTVSLGHRLDQPSGFAPRRYRSRLSVSAAREAAA